MSQWVVETGIADWERLTRETGLPLSLAFNLSVAQFVSHDHVQKILQVLGNPGLAHDYRVTFELTESVKVSDNERYIDILRQLRQAGCQLAIDDFGMGYSSLSYLKRMPIDIIKIDKSFIHDINSDPTDAAMIRAILQMARAFNIETVAEGVETPEQLSFLKEHGCTYAQGYLFSKALPFLEFVEFAKRARSD